jgi:hypothetical protein
MTKTNVLVFAFCILIYATTAKAQNAVPAAGGNASGKGGTQSYSVGQIVYTTDNGANGITSKGVQQPFEISVVTGIKQFSDISLEGVVYPNPTTDFVKLKIEKYEDENLSYQLFDNNGKLLLNNKIEGAETYIQMENLISATYFLKITDKNKEIKIFKIIKN